MDIPKDRDPHFHLTFNEANILMENLRTQNKYEFMSRLTNLRENTTDPVLSADLSALAVKIRELTDAEFELMKEDLLQGKLLFPPNYTLPQHNNF